MIRRVLIGIALIVFFLSVVLPLLWMALTSFKSSSEIFAAPWALPKVMHLDNYTRAWREAGIAQCFANSLEITIATLALLLPIGAMAAYVFAHYPFRGSKLLFGTFIGGMMIPQFLGLMLVMSRFSRFRSSALLIF